MGKKDKKSKKDKRRRSRSRSPSSSPSSSSSPSPSRSRSRSRDRSDRKRKHSKSEKKSSTKKESRSRSRSRSRERKKRKRSPSSSSSSSSPSRSRSPKREVKREPTPASSSSTTSTSHLSSHELKRIKAEEKARLKATETPAEKAARRAAKKALKHGASSSASLLASNPLAIASVATTGDNKPFVWKKKYEKNIAEGLDPKILTRAELAAKQVELQEEIAAIKARKIARAEEKEQMDALREQMQREAEMENIEGWEEKEEEFHRKNAELRTEIRIKEGREKLIDVLAKNRLLYRKLRKGLTSDEREQHPEWLGSVLNPNLEPEKDIELTEAYKLLTSGDIPWRDLEFLEQDIQAIKVLEKDDLEYWQACEALTRQSIVKQKAAAFAAGAQYRSSYGAAAQMPPPMPPKTAADSLKEEMATLLRGKTLNELIKLERDIGALLSGQRPSALLHLESMDHNYWETLKGEIVNFKYSAYLREFHIDLLELRLKDLQVYIQNEEAASRKRLEEQRAERLARGETVTDETMADELMRDGEVDEEMDFEPTLIPHAEYEGGAAAEEEEDGSFSPVLIPVDEDEMVEKHARAIAAIDPEADARQLAEQRRAVAEQKQREQEERSKLAAGSAVSASVIGAAAAASSSSSAAFDANDAAFRRESGRALEGDEVQLRQEFVIPAQTYWWHDRYRPRKPRFFNRVKTGFEWNKYNTTHYDKENPPPKIVQGYKFNIFYPDLIDPAVAPRYRIEPDPNGNPDFCIIRFMAGPPYEDLAFKIVKKEWEYSFKRGYKCVFDKSVLQLHFNFRRYFYRR